MHGLTTHYGTWASERESARAAGLPLTAAVEGLTPAGSNECAKARISPTRNSEQPILPISQRQPGKAYNEAYNKAVVVNTAEGRLSQQILVQRGRAPGLAHVVSVLEAAASGYFPGPFA